MEMLQGRVMLKAAHVCMAKAQDKALGLHWQELN